MCIRYFFGLFSACCMIALCNCEQKPKTETPHFTKLDSLTDTYLALQDSMLQVWNSMINDDNQKLEAMHNLLHELLVAGATDRDLLKSFEGRLEQLRHSRYTQKTMANPDIVAEYDFASSTLVSELITLAEQQTQFSYNTTLQKLTDNIRTADQRVNNYRQEYDRIAQEYNRFLDQNKKMLTQIDRDTFLEKKPLFQMVAEDEQ
jgi:hypothetical protein